MEWVNQEWDKPNRTDYYLMQIAQEVVRVLHKNPRQVKLEQFKLSSKPLVAKPKMSSDAQREQAARWSKAVWNARIKAASNKRIRRKE